MYYAYSEEYKGYKENIIIYLAIFQIKILIINIFYQICKTENKRKNYVWKPYKAG